MSAGFNLVLIHCKDTVHKYSRRARACTTATFRILDAQIFLRATPTTEVVHPDINPATRGRVGEGCNRVPAVQELPAH